MKDKHQQMLKAIDDSIEHWEENLLLTAMSATISNATSGSLCALCIHCNEITDAVLHQCSLCPIAVQGGRTQCYDTPYILARASLILDRDSVAQRRATIAWRSACRQEIEFLKEVRHHYLTVQIKDQQDGNANHS